MTKLPLILAALSLSAACATTPLLEPTAGPVSPSLLGAGTAERLSSGRNETMVRAYLPNAENPTALGTEVAGAECSLRSDELRASVVTPQAVILPTFKQRGALEDRGVPGALLVSCDYRGQTGRTLLTAQEKEVAVVSGAGLGGLVLGLAVSGIAANTTPWRFEPSAAVVLNNQ